MSRSAAATSLACAMACAMACAVPVDLGSVDITAATTSFGEATGSPITMEASSVGDTSTASTSGTVDTDTQGTVDDPRAFAIRLGDLPDVGTEETGPDATTAGSSDAGSSDAGSSGASTSTGGADAGAEVGSDTDPDVPSDPDALLVVVTNGPASCVDPSAPLPCPSAYRYSFVLPVELQFTGATGDLMQNQGSFSEAAGPGPACGFGGGTLAGRFEIAFIDQTRVDGRLFELDAFVPVPEVAFEAGRCSP